MHHTQRGGVYTNIYIYTYVYIYIERKRESERTTRPICDELVDFDKMMLWNGPRRGGATVIDVFQKGYTLNGRLVRPAMVVVAKGENQ